MWEKNLNALMATILSCVIWGAIAIQFIEHEEPCPLCLLQRLGMLGVATGALMNIRFGVRKLHYGLSILSAFFGGFVALRQIAFHACPGFPTFGKPFWGLNLYTWSFIVFATSAAYMGVLLLIFDKKENPLESKSTNWWGHLAFFLTLAVSLTNIFTTLWECGLGACRG